jgi:hypothetical protein
VPWATPTLNHLSPPSLGKPEKADNRRCCVDYTATEQIVVLRRLFGVSEWDPYRGPTPEAFALQEKRRRWFWLAIISVALAALVASLL